MTTYQRICFDAEDNPPLSYYANDDDDNKNCDFKKLKSKNVEISVTGDDNTPQVHSGAVKIDPKEWVKAPEFVPKSRQQQQQQHGDILPTKNAENGFTHISNDSQKQQQQCQQTYSANAMTRTNGQMSPLFPYLPGRPVLPPLVSFNPFGSHNSMLNVSMNPLPPTARSAAPIPPGLLANPIGGVLPMNMAGLRRAVVPRLAVRPPMKFPYHQLITRPHIRNQQQNIVACNRLPPHLPPGYTANVTAINPGMGPPIPAIVLKKKRKKRNKRQPNKMADNEPECRTPSPQDPVSAPILDMTRTDPSGTISKDSSPTVDESLNNELASSEPDLSKMPTIEMELLEQSLADIEEQTMINTGSCPDLTDADRHIWDHFLYAAARGVDDTMENSDEKDLYEETARHDNEYELCNQPLLSAYAADASIPISAINHQDHQLRTATEYEQSRENSVDRLLDESQSASPSSGKKCKRKTPKSLLDELEDYERAKVHGSLATVVQRSDDARLDSVQVTHDLIFKNDYRDEINSGMRITVNSFEDPEELTLSESEDSPIEVSRFEQIHSVLKQKGLQYVSVKPPDRVCCSIM